MTSFSVSPNRFLRLRQVIDLVGLRKTTLYARIGEGSFPKPVSLGGRSVAWIESEVIDWQNARITASRGQSAAELP
jgi:prophage regulatory protein